MTAGFCHEDPKIARERGTELVGWYSHQQRGAGQAGMAGR